MTIQEILEQSPEQAVASLRKRPAGKEDQSSWIKQYNPETHDINDVTVRPNKTIRNSSGELVSRAVARLPLALQRLIVDRQVSFMLGEGITVEASPQNDSETTVLEMIKRTWEDNKLDYRTKQLARHLFSETEAAELWYLDDAKDSWDGIAVKGVKFRLRMQILAPTLGDGLYPHFDDKGDMDAFSRYYIIDKVEYLDTYTAEAMYRYQRLPRGWSLTDTQANVFGKIPVIYYTIKEPIWSIVQPLIDRMEVLISNQADANDYFASPMVKVKGLVTGFADKGEQGKMIQLEENAEVDYLTWTQAPEAVKFEKETLLEMIYTTTQTPDISFDKVKGIGNLSGTAIKMTFMDAKLKSEANQEEFGEGIQRRLNLLRAGLAAIAVSIAAAAKSLRVVPEFNFYLPTNDMERVQMLSMALGGGRAIMSRETAVGYNPFVDDTTTELEKIKDDEAGAFGQVFEQE